MLQSHRSHSGCAGCVLLIRLTANSQHQVKRQVSLLAHFLEFKSKNSAYLDTRLQNESLKCEKVQVYNKTIINYIMLIFSIARAGQQNDRLRSS